MNQIIFTKIRDVKTPTRANLHDAGIDFYVPDINNRLIQDIIEKNPQKGWNIVDMGEPKEKALVINPSSRILIPSGIRVWIQDKQSALIAANKSGVATKSGLLFTAQVVDADYTGEIHIGLYNSGHQPVAIKGGDKIIQFVHAPILNDPLVEYSIEMYENMLKGVFTDRGENGFGSTDKI